MRRFSLIAAIALYSLGAANSPFRQDLQFFARELPKRHKNAFHYTSREQSQAAVAALDSRLDSIDEDGFFVGLMRIGSMIGDAHTRVRLPEADQRVYPRAIGHFGESYRVTQAGTGLEKAVGAKLVKIDDTDAARFFEILSPCVRRMKTRAMRRPGSTFFFAMRAPYTAPGSPTAAKAPPTPSKATMAYRFHWN